MRPLVCLAGLLALVGPVAIGCNQNPFRSAQQSPAWGASSPTQTSAVAQLQGLQQRVQQLDANNQDLHKQLAQSQQQAQLTRDQVALLQKRLGETANQLQDVQAAKAEADQQIQTLLASTRYRGGATITANSSLRDSLKSVELPGFDVRRDDDVIRITIPADQLFAAGTLQWQRDADAVLDQLASAVARHYPRQKLSIEGHTDSSPVGVAQTSNHHLSMSQALAVFQQLTIRHRLPARQLITVGHGANHPLVSNATPAGRAKNRRIEVVVYPDPLQGR